MELRSRAFLKIPRFQPQRFQITFDWMFNVSIWLMNNRQLSLSLHLLLTFLCDRSFETLFFSSVTDLLQHTFRFYTFLDGCRWLFSVVNSLLRCLPHFFFPPVFLSLSFLCSSRFSLIVLFFQSFFGFNVFFPTFFRWLDFSRMNEFIFFMKERSKKEMNEGKERWRKEMKEKEG